MSATTLVFLAALHVKAAIFTTLVLTVLYMARRVSSQNRYLVLTMALAVLTVLPLLMLSLPSYLVSLDWWPALATDSPSIARDYPSESESATPVEQGFSITTLILAGYTAVSALLLLRIAVSFLRTRKDIGNYRRIDQAEVLSMLDQVRRRLGLEIDVELVLDAGGGPYVWGIAKPIVAVPPAFMNATPDIQRTVLTHELIHILRRDTTLCLISRVLCCWYWINPAVWLLNAKLKLEMEQSCDDRVVCSGINAADYAGHLLKAIKQFDVIHRPDSAVAMARASSIKNRIHSLLNNERPRGIMSTSKSVGVCTVLVLLGIAIGSVAATPPAPTATADEALLAGVKRHIPELCDMALREVTFAYGAMEFKGHCESSTRISAFMRSLDRAGAVPKLIEVKKIESGFDYKLRLENLKVFAPTEKVGKTQGSGCAPQCRAWENFRIGDLWNEFLMQS